MTDPENIQWQRKSFKKNKVWVACDSTGNPLVKNNKVRIKYNLDQDYEYWIAPKSLRPEQEAVASADRNKKKADTTSPKHLPADLPKNCICIYTDGASSGNPGPSGIGVVLIYKENRREISEYIGEATNNIAELTAIHRALSVLKRQDLPVRIFTDSEYAVGLLSQDWKPRANKTLVHDIRGLMSRFDDLKLIKVRGHDGIKENEVADFLAVSAVKQKGQKQ
jgi:ribonuclease HI